LLVVQQPAANSHFMVGQPSVSPKSHPSLMGGVLHEPSTGSLESLRHACLPTSAWRVHHNEEYDVEARMPFNLFPEHRSWFISNWQHAAIFLSRDERIDNLERQKLSSHSIRSKMMTQNHRRSSKTPKSMGHLTGAVNAHLGPGPTQMSLHIIRASFSRCRLRMRAFPCHRARLPHRNL
jgi:hypothetical protein